MYKHFLTILVLRSKLNKENLPVWFLRMLQREWNLSVRLQTSNIIFENNFVFEIVFLEMKTHIHVEWQYMYLKLRCNCRFMNFYVNLQFQSQSLPAHQVQGDNTATQVSSDNSPVKRRRGRPRGTPNKPLLPDRTNTKSRCFFGFHQMWSVGNIVKQ